MRFYITVFIVILSFFTQLLFSQNNERDEIVKWANYYMNKNYKYNQSDTITNPFTKEKKKVNFDCSGFVAAVYFTAIEKPSIKLSGSTANIFYLLSKENKTYKNTLSFWYSNRC